MSSITQDIDYISKLLQQGEIAAIPTETVYGLAGNAENETAVRKIYALKNRPLHHPLILHVAEDVDLSRWVHSISNEAQKLIKAFWPGPLTLIFSNITSNVHPIITGGQSTLAIRCPNHPIAQQLLKSLPFPLVAPSANPFGKISPTTAEHVRNSFLDHPLPILDGGRCRLGIESTIVAIMESGEYQILRQGALDAEQLAQVIQKKSTASTETTIRTPGRLAAHYQPTKPLYYFESLEAMQQLAQRHGSTSFILSFKKEELFANLPGYQLPHSPQQLAYELYYQLRRADESQAQYLFIELPPNTQAWQAIRERIMKAGHAQW